VRADRVDHRAVDVHRQVRLGPMSSSERRSRLRQGDPAQRHLRSQRGREVVRLGQHVGRGPGHVQARRIGLRGSQSPLLLHQQNELQRMYPGEQTIFTLGNPNESLIVTKTMELKKRNYSSDR
jgi:hypothetical protein